MRGNKKRSPLLRGKTPRAPLLATVALAGAGLLAACTAPVESEPPEGSVQGGRACGRGRKPGGAPTRPPARVRGSKSLRGPARGAVRARGSSAPVRISAERPARAPSGATFWLKPGVHRLGGGAVRSGRAPRTVRRSSEPPAPSSTAKTPTTTPSPSSATGVTIEYLTIQNFGVSRGQQQRGRGQPRRRRRLDHPPQHHPETTPARVSSSETDTIVEHNCLHRQRPVRLQRLRAATVSPTFLGTTRSPTTTPMTGRPATGLRLHRRRQVLGDHGARVTNNYVHHNTASASGRTPTTRIPHRGQLYQTTTPRPLLRDQLQRPDHQQHLRA